MSADCLTFEKTGFNSYLITDDDLTMPNRTMRDVRAYIRVHFPGIKLPRKLESFYFNYSGGYMGINGKEIKKND